MFSFINHMMQFDETYTKLNIKFSRDSLHNNVLCNQSTTLHKYICTHNFLMIYIPSCRQVYIYIPTAFSWLPHNPESNHTAVYKIYLEISRTRIYTYNFSFLIINYTSCWCSVHHFYTVKRIKLTHADVCIITKPMQNNTNTPTLCAIVNIIKTDSKIYNIYTLILFIFLFVDT